MVKDTEGRTGITAIDLIREALAALDEIESARIVQSGQVPDEQLASFRLTKDETGTRH